MSRARRRSGDPVHHASGLRAVPAVGTSSGVAATSPTATDFVVSITAGHTYWLEIVSSASGEGVFGLGTVEAVG